MLAYCVKSSTNATSDQIKMRERGGGGGGEGGREGSLAEPDPHSQEKKEKEGLAPRDQREGMESERYSTHAR